MILNEDFFNDVEIKDEDLTVEEPAEKPTEEYNEKTSRELIEYKMSESEMLLFISIMYPENFNIWRRIERVMKRLKYMFDIYNININLSEPFIMYASISSDILKDKEFPDKKDNYTIIQHEGCNLYFPEDKLRKYGPDKTVKDEVLKVLVFLDKKVPVFKTARSAYNFAINLDKCFWKDNTDSGNECFYSYGLYNINKNKICNGGKVIESYSFNNSYVNDYAIWIYNGVLNIVPKEVAY